MPYRGIAPHPVAAFAIVALLLAASIAIFLPTAQSMASIWSRSGTFAHGWLVLPATLWFVWQRRDALTTMPLRPWWPALLGVTAGGAIWLLAELSSSQSPEYFGLVIMAVSAVVAVTGLAWARILAFPLAFLLFAVPFGDALIPVLIDLTADFTVAALQLSGVPVYREGNDFTIPSGRWSVVEACSGVRYLLASLMAGTLYAWVIYRSARRRALFVAASIIVPIVANWFRAYLIVMLGHLSNNQLATGFDHLVYGWVFFGAVMLPMFAIGARWREDDAAVAAVARPQTVQMTPWAVVAPATVTLACLVAWQGIAARTLTPVDARPVLPVSPTPDRGWSSDSSARGWRPQLQSPRATLNEVFVQGDRRVALHVGFYRAQRQGSELVNWANTVAVRHNGRREVAAGQIEAAIDGKPLVWRSFIVRGDAGAYERVWIAYWLDGRWTVSDARAKLDLALDRLLRRSDTSAWVGLSAPHNPEHPEGSAATLRAFVSDMGPSLQRALQLTAAR
jgi:exosortase A